MQKFWKKSSKNSGIFLKFSAGIPRGPVRGPQGSPRERQGRDHVATGRDMVATGRTLGATRRILGAPKRTPSRQGRNLVANFFRPLEKIRVFSYHLLRELLFFKKKFFSRKFRRQNFFSKIFRLFRLGIFNDHPAKEQNFAKFFPKKSF